MSALTAREAEAGGLLTASAPMKNERAASPPKKKLRRGKWTAEEEAYVERIIHDFNSGLLDVPAGTTLRSYLSQKLNCDPMRITKKFTGASCIGKRVFHPRGDRSGTGAKELAQAKEELVTLEARWRQRLQEMENDTSGKAGMRSRRGDRGNGLSPGRDLSSTTQTPQAYHGVDDWQTRILGWLHRAEQALQDEAVCVADLDLLTEEGNSLKVRRGAAVVPELPEDRDQRDEDEGDEAGTRDEHQPQAQLAHLRLTQLQQQQQRQHLHQPQHQQEQSTQQRRQHAGSGILTGNGTSSFASGSPSFETGASPLRHDLDAGKSTEVDAGAALFNLRKNM